MKKKSGSSFKKLITEIGDSPKKAVTAVNKLIDQVGSGLSGTVEFEVPEKYAQLFTKFSDVGDNSNAKDVKDALKGFKYDKISESFTKGKMKSVSFDLGKAKNIFKKNSKLVAEHSEKMEESISILGEDVIDDTVVMGVGGFGAGFGIGFAIISLAIACYAVYVTYLMHKYDVSNAIIDESEEPSTLKGILSTGLQFLFPLIYYILIHIRIRKMKKNESVDSDSIIDMFEAEEYDVIKNGSGDANHDSELIEAYRKVVEDLTRRVPSNNNAMI